jgi:phage baseplate assembly protein V
MIRLINKVVAPLGRAVRGMVLRGVITLVNDAAALERVQVQLRAMPQASGGPAGAELADDLERFQQYGFTASPLEGAEALVLAVNGVKAHGVVIAVDDRRYRLTGLPGGDVAMYDFRGQLVRMSATGITIYTPQTITLDAPNVACTGNLQVAGDVQLGGEGGAAVARVGDTVSGGVITSGSSKVTAA